MEGELDPITKLFESIGKKTGYHRNLSGIGRVFCFPGRQEAEGFIDTNSGISLIHSAAEYQ